MHVVITGATGQIGTQLTHLLLQQGHRVTAVARPSARLDALYQAGAAIAPGTLSEVAFLTDTLRGADAAFLLMPLAPQAADVLAEQDAVGEAIAAAVRQSGLTKAVHLSSTGATETGIAIGLHRQEARLNAIEGLQVAHLRPAYFMENLLGNLPLIQQMGITGSAVRADLRFPMVATQDIAAKAAEVLTSDFTSGAAYTLLGPQNYSLTDAAHAIGQAISRPELSYVSFPYDDARKGMVQAGLSESMADLYDEIAHGMNEGKVLAHEYRDATSTTPTTLETFAQTVFAPAFQAAMAQ